jgi:hypothetical protein
MKIHVNNTNLDLPDKKYELFESTGSQTISGSLVHHVLRINGASNVIRNGLQIWNTSSHKFQPTEAGKQYAMRLDGIMSCSSGQPTFHIDFEVSGNIPIGVAGASHAAHSINRQTLDIDLRSSFDHSHFHGCYLILTDASMVASGAQFYGATTSQEITFTSATLFISER